MCSACGDRKIVEGKSHHGGLCALCWAKVVHCCRTYKGDDYNWQTWPATPVEDLKQRSLGARAAYRRLAECDNDKAAAAYLTPGTKAWGRS